MIGDKTDNLINGIKYYKYAKSATKNPGSDSVVLGKYSQTGYSYDKVAIQKGATYFNLDNWNSVCNKIGKSNMWKINQKFLEQQISQEKNFLLTHDPYRATGYFAKEVDFLLQKGYEFIQDGSIWQAIK